MSSYVAVEFVEIVLPMGAIGLFAERSARRERARVARLVRTARDGRITLERTSDGPLTRLHARRMRRRLARAGLAPARPRRPHGSRRPEAIR